MSKPIEETFELFTLKEMQMMALQGALLRAGVEDPVKYLTENKVDYRSAFRPAVGMSIVILGVSPLTPPEEP